jgi:hypothetical protein
MKLSCALIALAATSLDYTATGNNEVQSYIRRRNDAEAHREADSVAKVCLCFVFF